MNNSKFKNFKLPQMIQSYLIDGVYAGAIRGAEAEAGTQGTLDVKSPVNGECVSAVSVASGAQLEASVAQAHEAYQSWRLIPPPQRGALVLEVAQCVRKEKQALAQLISIEMGKILTEAEGEVQEWIDMCDFAVGLSRQLYGLTIASERPQHRLMEQWHPLGAVGVITAFNFPMAVWAWNAMIALVCGNTLVWKPSEKTPLCALACHAILQQALQAFPQWKGFSNGLSTLVVGGSSLGKAIASHPNIPLVSATGSVAMGRSVAKVVASRLGRSLLELGGNNALVISDKADLALAVRGIVFSAVGTCGQRCTSLRRLFVQSTHMDKLLPRLKKIYQQIKIGSPLDDSSLVGPLIDAQAFHLMEAAIRRAKEAGAEVIYGGGRYNAGDEATQCSEAWYVIPAIIKIKPDAAILAEETFAPILYVVEYQSLDEAIRWNNQVSQGLSSAIFTTDVREAEYFMSPAGADTGIVNVNIGTSGAEIGGAFGGEKDTGGGRESGSDAWKSYMRRATNTINYGNDLPLAQGIRFDL